MTNSNKTCASKLSSLSWAIIAVLVFAILLMLGYKFKDSLFDSEATIVAALDKSCDLRKGRCSSALPSGAKVIFSINPHDIPLLKPLQLTVEMEGVHAIKVEVDFIGIGMDMGYNRSNLDRIDKSHFSGESILPVCAHSKMDWEARVLLYTEKA